MRCNEFAGWYPLQGGINCRQEHRRLVATFDPGKPRQRCHALRNHSRIGRDAVVRQAIPRGEFHHFDIGAEKCQCARQRRHALTVAADHGQGNRRRVFARGDRAREIGQHQAFSPISDLGQRKDLARLELLGG